MQHFSNRQQWHTTKPSCNSSYPMQALRSSRSSQMALRGKNCPKTRPVDWRANAASISAPEIGSGRAKDCGSSCDQGLRDGMEDYLKLFLDDAGQYTYCAVFDGHGGPQAAEWLAAELHGIVGQHMQGTDAQEDFAAAITAAFEQADKQLMSHLEKQGNEVLSNAGSTGTVVVVRQNQVLVANLGDSQAFLLRKNQPFELTTPHRVYGSGEQVRAEISRVKSAGGWIHDGRVCNILAVSRAFGDWEFKGEGLKRLLQGGVEREYWKQSFADKQSFTSDPVIVTPAVSQTELGPDDEILVVATDGLWDVVPPNDGMRFAKNKLKTGQSAQQVAEGLVAMALKRKTTDNVSCIVIDFKGKEHWSADNSAQPSWLGGLFGKK